MLVVQRLSEVIVFNSRILLNDFNSGLIVAVQLSSRLSPKCGLLSLLVSLRLAGLSLYWLASNAAFDRARTPLAV